MRIKKLLGFILLVLCTTAALPSQKGIEEALTCQCGCGLTVHSCNHLQCGFAVPIKEKIAEQLAQGTPKEKILTQFVSQYGEKILSAPTTSGFNLAAWITPFLVVLIGGVLLGLVSLRWSRRQPQVPSGPPASPPDTDPYRDRLQQELETFDR